MTRSVARSLFNGIMMTALTIAVASCQVKSSIAEKGKPANREDYEFTYLNLRSLNREDNKSEWSGITLIYNEKTGCQYISLDEGGITPSLDENGKPICFNTAKKK